MADKKIKFSVIIPVFNESEIIGRVIGELGSFLESNYSGDYEIIAVNDGSRDESLMVLEKITASNFYFLNNIYNKGYGSSLKRGAKEARGEWLVFYDGDGQHTPLELKKLLDNLDNCDMAVGARKKYNGPKWRQPGKRFISALSNYLVKFKIPDINSGLRVVRKECFDRFSHLYPKGFSLSTTITLAFLKEGYTVKYIPVNVESRVGKSSVKIADGFNTVNLIVKLIMLFAPLRIFFPAFVVVFILCLVSLFVDLFVYSFNLSESTLILLLSSILFLFLGLIADQIASLRREIKS